MALYNAIKFCIGRDFCDTVTNSKFQNIKKKKKKAKYRVNKFHPKICKTN